MTILHFNGKYLDLTTPKLMAIVNLTLDSFYAESQHKLDDKLFAFIDYSLENGTSIIDIGAMSSKPYSKEKSEQDELETLLPVVSKIRKRYPKTFISIDTYRSSIASVMLESGVDMINDIYAGRADKDMLPLIGDKNVPYVMMHMQGTPQNMQDNVQYENVVLEILAFLSKQKKIVESFGGTQSILDPGFGFGKTIEHNYEILRKLAVLKILDAPILAGLSRKSMIYKLLDIDPAEALNGTSGLNLVALLNGASILRVHDAKEANEMIKLSQHL